MNQEENKISNKAQSELEILKYWQEKDIFQKTLKQTEGSDEFVFYEGPPTANAKPALHHLEARAFKDVLPRFKTMQGFHVRRKAGWDTHGLPVELQIEKKLELKSKKDIEEYGVAKFNKECKDSVFEFIGLWEKFTDRMGYWVDKENAYYTFDKKYVESLWNIVSKINERKLFYKDYRIVPWCTRCGTGLSSHELAQEYQDVKDLSVYVKFKIVGFPKAYFLVWTTTPWTLPGNVALAVGADIEYVEAKVGEEIFVLAKNKLDLIKEDYEILATHKGSEMAGMEFEPLFNELRVNLQSPESRKEEFSNWVNGWKIYLGDFVNTEDGTGIVHIAPMYGADDFELAKKNNLPKLHTVDENGNFISNLVPEKFAGRYVKESDENGKPTLAVDIVNYLKENDLFFAQENIKHSYPHCWRCKTPLIYFARDSWYISMSKLRDDLIKANETINWEPSHIKEGRFGEWLREVKDWAISRERYWGTPLPIWESKDGEKLYIDSFDNLKKFTKKSGNKYTAIRHGRGEHMDLNVCAPLQGDKYHLTEIGREQARSAGGNLKGENITMIIASPLIRTQETAKIVAEQIGYPVENIITDDRIQEYEYGDKAGEDFDRFIEFRTQKINNYYEKFGSTSFGDVKNRVGEFIYDIEKKYQNENILIVTHGVFFETMESIIKGDNEKEARETLVNFKKPEPAEWRIMDFIPLPHNENYELDPHKPYIDEIKLEKDGVEYIRTKEVMDCWFDSGSMPFAQDHYPFENMDWVDGAGFPADFISEAIDQTRGWFYTMLAVGVLMERGAPYKNVICLGHLLDKDGRKMSKSIGNIIEPFEQMEKFGADAVRFWMYSVNSPGEGKNYDEKSIDEISRKVFQTLDNCYKMYELYKMGNENVDFMQSENLLDKWIISKLNNLISDVTNNLQNYNLFNPTRDIKDFISDFSTWYIRRSRERFKSDDINDKSFALATTKHTITEISKLLAPFCPFFAEDLYLKATESMARESVHLESWPKEGSIDQLVLDEMEITRNMVSLGMLARQKANIKVKQPLASITFKNNLISHNLELLQIIKDELNVKEVLQSAKIENEVELDINITQELKLEGDYRELLRAVQDMRKEMNLIPSDKINITVSLNGENILNPFISDFKKTAGVQNVKIEENEGKGIIAGDCVIKIVIEK